MDQTQTATEDKTAINFYLEPEDAAKLKFLIAYDNRNISDTFRNLLRREYQRIHQSAAPQQ